MAIRFAGNVDKAGSRLSGEGFKSKWIAPGQYSVRYDSPLSELPAATVTARSEIGGSRSATFTTFGLDGFNVIFRDMADDLKDVAFSFIVVDSSD